MNIDLKGRWAGEYIYGATYGPQLEGKKGDFVMYVEEVHENGFKGKVIETDGDDEFHQSALEGFIDDLFISFVKRLDKYRYFDDDLNMVEEEGSEGYEVQYQGTYNKAIQQFSGGWEIRYDLTPLSVQEGLEQFWNGTWWMKKVE